ncbi:hypothetical protein chiPu_0016365 [Chiloscyllium punctatum]|uniref:Uncharacterized protein n=1 Tax=Chiloscyllium punctatum TaxID=137246 RepID=A0A401T5G3_CHIPU|nr:hypothetical protein [Chiloscyllium punctatum]
MTQCAMASAGDGLSLEFLPERSEQWTDTSAGHQRGMTLLIRNAVALKDVGIPSVILEMQEILANLCAKRFDARQQTFRGSDWVEPRSALGLPVLAQLMLT